MMKKYSLFFLISIFFIFIISPESAYAKLMDGQYPACSTSCADPKPYDFCNNGPSNTDSGGCGTACEIGSAWTKYNVECKNVADPKSFYEDCMWAWVVSGNVCSTADKYNSGNPPIMNAGDCSCNVGGSYKTCCSGSTPVNASHGPIDPYDPDEAWCGNNSIVYCGQGGQPACSQAACFSLSPG